MSKKNLYLIIALMTIALSYLSYQQYKINKELEEWKGYYKSVSISYLQSIIEPPELKAPTMEEMDINLVDFEISTCYNSKI